MRKYIALAAMVLVVAAAAGPTSAMADDHHDRVSVVREGDATLPTHTIYRPAELRNANRLPVVVWENGACANSNRIYEPFLTRLASAGYFVIAKGPVTNPPVYEDTLLPLPATSPLLDPDPPLEPPAPAGKTDAEPTGFDTIIDTAVGLMKSAVDWAQEADSNPQGPYYGKLDLSSIASAGYSCGGVTAIAAAARDSRFRTVLGYNTSSSAAAGLSQPRRAALLGLKVPVAWIMGGTSDVAYPGFQSDWAMRFEVPAFQAEHLYAGHVGFWRSTAFEEEVADIGTAWLDLTLGGDSHAADYLLDNPCGFCDNQYWSTKSRNWPRDWRRS